MSTTKRASVKNRSPLDELFLRSEQAKTGEGPVQEIDVDKPETSNEIGKPRQTTLMLFDRHLDWLDQKCSEARSNGGKPIRKTALIRSLIELAITAPVDLKGLTSEHELVERIEKAIKNK